MIQAVKLVIITEDKRILLLRKTKKWFLPGGKILYEETEENALKRELSQELPDFNYVLEKRYGCFSDTNSDHLSYDKTIDVAVYFGIPHNTSIRPSAEINSAEFVSNPERYKLSKLTSTIIKDLREHGKF